MEYSIEEKEGVKIVAVDDLSLDSENDKLLEELTSYINDGFSEFIVDLKSLRFLNSTGLNLLIRLLTKSRTVGGEVALVNVSDQIDNLLIVTKLHSLFVIAGTIEDGLKALKPVA